MDWRLRDRAARRVLLLVSKFDHCLGDLLYRQRIGELTWIVGHRLQSPARGLARSRFGDIPFHHLPVTKAKPEQERQI